jgi:hypothetical protein
VFFVKRSKALSGSSQERFRVYCKTLNKKGKKTSRQLAYPSHNFFSFPEREKNRRESKSDRERPSSGSDLLFFQA